MNSKIYGDPKVLEAQWGNTPTWAVYASTAPSFLLWFAIMIWLESMVIFMLMMFTAGIPTTLLHEIFKRVCIYLYDKGPSIRLYLLFFIGQTATYTGVIYIVAKS